jgi:ABC-type Fe3+ transport system substrate-binding protein
MKHEQPSVPNLRRREAMRKLGLFLTKGFISLMFFFCLVFPNNTIAADASLIAAAKKEGTVVWYVSLIQNQIVRPIAEAFEKKYGIKVEYPSGTTTDMALKLLTESRAGKIQADVSHGGSVIGPVMAAGLVEKFVPSSAANYPSEYKNPSGYWTGECLNFLVATINTERVSPADAPKTYQDLLDPKWSNGKIAWTVQMSQSGAAGFIGTILTAMGQDAGTSYLQKLAKQKLVNVPANQRVVLDQVISGQHALALATFNHHAEISIAKGAPIKWLKLEPVTGTVDVIFLLKNAPHPNAGKLLIDFVLSSEGQNVFKKAGYIPADPHVPADIPGLKPEAGGFKAVILTPENIMKNMQTWVDVYDKYFK